MERVVLVDGSNLVYRAFFALPSSLMTGDGLHTNAIYGFAVMFRKLFMGKMPALGAVVFDAGGVTERERKYPQYKADRAAMPGDLAAQLPKVHALIAAHGFPIVQLRGVEADDIIGTLTREALEAGHDVQIVTSDKDFAQLVCERVRMVDTMPRTMGGPRGGRQPTEVTTFDAELVKKKWGVWPTQMIDYLALVGDKVDCVPGVPGIGEKSAVELLEALGSFDRILAEADKPADPATPASDTPLKPRQKKALVEHRDLALLSKDLVTIDQHIPLPVKLVDLRIREVDPAERNQLFVDLQFYSLLDDASKEALADDDADADYGALTAADELASFLSRPSAVAVLPIFEDVPAAAFMLPEPLAGLALAVDVGHARYVPLVGSNSIGPELRAVLAAWLADPAKPKVCHDAKALWRALRVLGLDLAGVAFDTQLASFLIDPTKIIPHRLDQLCKEFLQRTLRPAKSVIGAGQKQIRFSQAAPATLAAWACHLVDAVLAMQPIIAERLEAEGQTQHLLTHELPLTWVLGQMERDGILVDGEDLRLLGIEFGERLTAYEAEIWAHAGHPFNLASTKQLAEVLFEELKLPVLKKTRTGYSTDAEVLEELAAQHDICRLLVEHRKLAKLVNTYTDVLQRSVNPQTGRVHATFQQTTGATGRLISTDPDLQRTPIHTPEGKRIREAFVAPPGRRLIVADWSQIELRLLAHVTGDPHLVEAFNARLDVHRRTASQIFGVALGDVTPAQRNIGKTINFATIYGQGASSLAQMLAIPSKDAKRYIESYFAYYAGVRAWLDRTTREALAAGYVTTMLGRRRYIPELSSHSPMERQAGIRVACNTPIQGSAADLCKLVMLALPARFEAAGLATKMLLQIHDELVFEAPEAEVASASAIVKEAMETLVPLRVPLVADVGVGASWAAAKGG